MTTEPSKLTATAGATPDSVQLFHNDFPDFRADGDSLQDAAANLVQDLTRELSEVEDEWPAIRSCGPSSMSRSSSNAPRPDEGGRPCHENAVGLRLRPARQPHHGSRHATDRHRKIPSVQARPFPWGFGGPGCPLRGGPILPTSRQANARGNSPKVSRLLAEHHRRFASDKPFCP